MMWGEQFATAPSGHLTSYSLRMSKSAPCSPVKPAAKRPPARVDSFHVVHKVPVGDTPYVKAKHVQLVDKDPDRAIALFWAAINAGDRVDSALKDMAIVMKQQNRPQEAIEAIKSLRGRCSDQAQESLDNVLLDLYKRCGRLDDQIALLKHKLHLIHQGMAFNGKRTKTARSQGKKFQVSIEQEATRLLGNLGWAYMQQLNFVAAEAVYRKALSIEPDNNKVCNLGICLMKQGRLEEAKAMLQSVTPACNDNRWASDSHLKSYERAQEMLLELETSMGAQRGGYENIMPDMSAFAIPGCDTGSYDLQQSSLWQPQPALPRQPRRMARSNLEQQFADSAMTGALLATAGFGPSSRPTNSNAPVPAAAPSMSNFGNHPGATQQAQSQQQWLQGASSGVWEDDDFDYSSPDENSDSNMHGNQQDATQGYSMAEIQQMQWHAETLRQRLESVSVLGKAFMDRQQLAPKQDAKATTSLPKIPGRTISPPLSEQLLSSEAAPFNPAAAKEPVAAAVPRPTLEPASENAAAPRPPAASGRAFGGDRVPLTFDLTNGIRNAANGNNGHIGGQEERRVVKQLGAGGGWSSNDNNNHSNKQPLKSSTAGYGSGWNRGGDYDENQPTARRSLLMENNENPRSETSVVLQPLQQTQHANSGGLPPLHNAAGKRSRTLTPVKEKTVSAWGSLGFTHSPSDLDFGCGDVEPAEAGLAAPNTIADLSASEMEMKRQRRLRVFREMTLTAIPQCKLEIPSA